MLISIGVVAIVLLATPSAHGHLSSRLQQLELRVHPHPGVELQMAIG